MLQGLRILLVNIRLGNCEESFNGLAIIIPISEDSSQNLLENFKLFDITGSYMTPTQNHQSKTVSKSNDVSIRLYEIETRGLDLV